MAIPGVKQTKWYWLELAAEAALVVGAIIPLIVLVCQEFDKDGKHYGWWLITALAVAVIAGAFKIIVEIGRWKGRKHKDSPKDLSGCLCVLYETVRQKCGIPTEDTETLRVTIHRLVGEHLEQCVPYIGCSCDGEGRRFSKRSGIIGRAVMSKQPMVGTRTNGDADQYHKELAEVWHMPPDEAKKVRQDRWTWMAVPLRSVKGAEPPAVVYLDSSKPDLFTTEIQNLVIWACFGVAAFIQQRYPEER